MRCSIQRHVCSHDQYENTKGRKVANFENEVKERFLRRGCLEKSKQRTANAAFLMLVDNIQGKQVG